jgi:hypothetical protein
VAAAVVASVPRVAPAALVVRPVVPAVLLLAPRVLLPVLPLRARALPLARLQVPARAQVPAQVRVVVPRAPVALAPAVLLLLRSRPSFSAARARSSP